MSGKEHSSFNAAMATALLRIARRGQIELHFWGEETQYNSLFLCKKDQALVSQHPIVVAPGRDRKFARKVTIEIINIIRILRHAQRRKASVIFLSVCAPSMAALMLLRFCFRRVPVHLIIHGLDGLLRDEKQRITSYGLWNRLSLLRFYDGSWPASYVLGRGIRQRLLDYFPGVPALRHIEVIEHPFDFPTAYLAPAAEEISAIRERPMRIGFVGFGREDKGIDLFYLLAERMSDLVQTEAVRFILVGALHPACMQYHNEWVDRLEDGEDWTDPIQYQNQIRTLDCALFFGGDAYRLTASGSLFDTIAGGVKIVSLPNRYVEDLQADDPEGGITCVSGLDDMEQYLRESCKDGLGRRFRYDAIRNKHGIEQLERVLRDSLAKTPGFSAGKHG